MVVTWLSTTLIGVVFFYILYWMYKKYHYWDDKGIPNIKSVPILGMAMNLLVHKKNLNELVSQLYDGLEGFKFGGYMQIATPAIFLRDPDLIYRVMISDFSHFEDRNLRQTGNDLFSEALVTLTGNKWRHARHKLTPTFTSGKLKNMFDTIKECSDKAVHFLNDKTSQDFESKDLLLKFVLSVVGDVAFGLKLDTYNPESQESSDFLKAATKLFNPSIIVLIKILITSTSPKLQQALNIKVVDNEVNNYFSKLVKDLLEFRERTGTRRNDFLQLMLDEKRVESHASFDHQSSKHTKYETTHDTEEPEDKVLMQQLKHMQSPSNHEDIKIFTDKFIASQSFLFLAGGTENTSGIIGFTLFELATNPDCQRKLQEEIRNAVSDGFDYQSLSKMTYMDQVLHETFRLHPSASVLFRICTKNYTVPNTNFTIEKGTLVMIPALALHMDPQYFEDPDTFNPDRFQDMSSIRKGTFFSFGAGPRMCIGCFWAYNCEDSLSGSTVVLKKLKDLGENATFFGNTLKSGSHLQTFRMVLNKQAQAVDANALKYHREQLNDGGKDVIVLDSLGSLPPYPILLNSRLSSELKQKITATLLSMTKTGFWGERLTKFGIKSFVENSSDYYNFGKEMLENAKKTGIGVRYY